ncbi:MAG: DPP IV N-terminal domain-containing protein, partial [Saprospiraceae bacterium]|nr:DPP IV N-terminal domain-containing protein [Saprospiraceae bacterium]
MTGTINLLLPALKLRRVKLLILLLLPLSLFAQNKFSMSDAFLKRGALSPANLRQLQWIPETEQFTHIVGNKLVRVNAPNLTTDTLDLLPKINEGMVSLGVKVLDGMPGVTWTGADNMWFRTDKEIFTYSLTEGLKRKNWHPIESENVDIHDKTFFAAYTMGSDLWVNIGGKELGVVPSARDEGEGIVYGKSVHRDEFGIYKGTFWSPSGRYLAFYRMDESMVTQYPVYVLDSMPAVAREVRYPFAGSKSHHVTVGIFDTQTARTIYLKTGEPAEQYLTNVSWTPDNKYVLIAVVNRAQDHLWFNQYDAITGAFVKTIFEETSDKWVEPEKPAVFLPGSSDQFLWQSERDGYNHLYLCNLNGKTARQISKGALPVTAFYGFDTKGENCFYQVADETGMNRYVLTANLKTGVFTRLNEAEGTHNALVNSTGEWALDAFTNAATPRLIFLSRWTDPAKREIIFGAKNPLEGYALGLSRTSTIPSKGGMPLNTRMILPPDFDANKQYPVLLYLYGGPHAQLVTNTWLAGAELWMHHMAQEGYIIFTVDGRGSANRGLAFESAIHRRVGDVEIEDQLAGIEYLKAQTFVDTARIGVFGWSYGGFMTTSLMTRPESKDVFKCGVAGGPVIDWRMYEIMYTERY